MSSNMKQKAFIDFMRRVDASIEAGESTVVNGKIKLSRALAFESYRHKGREDDEENELYSDLFESLFDASILDEPNPEALAHLAGKSIEEVVPLPAWYFDEAFRKEIRDIREEEEPEPQALPVPPLPRKRTWN